jgi:hypothetical protein
VAEAGGAKYGVPHSGQCTVVADVGAVPGTDAPAGRIGDATAGRGIPGDAACVGTVGGSGVMLDSLVP